MKKFITLDVGTTAVKAAIFSEDLKLLASAVREYRLDAPGKGLLELNPDVYWDNAVAGIRQILEETGTAADEVASVTCTTQGETLIPVDEEGNALHNAVIWLDSRAQAEADEIAKSITPEQFYSKTGVPEINGYCPVAKLLWFKRNLPECYDRTHKFLLLEDYLVFRLSGKFVTNPSIMCTTGYFDIRNNELWSEILEVSGIDPQKIAEILPCGAVVSGLTDRAASELGLTTDTAVTTGAMDQTAGAVGAANVREGVVSETTGTAMVIAATAKEPQLDHLSAVNVYTHAIPGLYLNISMVQTAGMVQKWFRDELCQDLEGSAAFAEMSSLAAAAPPLSRGVMLYPHFTGIQEPANDPDARGVFFGIGLDADRGCLIRAIYEGIGYALRENLELMGLKPERIVSLGGGSKSDIWNQIKADICGAAVEVPVISEAASLGAAILGGVATGILPDIVSAAEMVEKDRQYPPMAGNTELYEKGYRKYCAMYERFAPLFKEG
ncbi:MAG: hypothetical protein IJ860_01015 [Eubacterium sp.]|nr:hypothetical protein [Eubacterium sp.]